MSFAIIKVPAAPVRRKARHQAEMINQLLFGEAVKICKEKKGGWIKVRSLHDQYEGWLTAHMLEMVSENEARTPVEFITAAPVTSVQFGDSSMSVPAGSVLRLLAGQEGKIGNLHYQFEGDAIKRPVEKFDSERLWQTTSAWLNAPYLWGGRTIMGVDCSGFTQVVFKQLGIDLPRDAWQQAQEGETVKRLKDVMPGDLAFFDDRDEIVHVGILLSSEKIIHAAGKVRIDTIDKKGIINVETGKRTHSLRIVKRPR
ncbi:MAG: C40 family peptidase [Chitinophagaceae bacterium]|nr:C40 family peptidase [Chitinophagaceae bacterium]